MKSLNKNFKSNYSSQLGWLRRKASQRQGVCAESRRITRNFLRDRGPSRLSQDTQIYHTPPSVYHIPLSGRTKGIYCAQSLSHIWLCNSLDSNPLGSSVHGILQARILEWVAISSCRGSLRPRDPTCISCVSCIGRRILYHCASWEAQRYLYLTPNSTYIPHKCPLA